MTEPSISIRTAERYVKEAKTYLNETLKDSPPHKCGRGGTLDRTKVLKKAVDTSEYTPNEDCYLARVQLQVACSKCKRGHEFLVYSVRKKRTHQKVTGEPINDYFLVDLGRRDIADMQPELASP